MYETMLKILGFNIVNTATNGEEAVNMYKSFSVKPDIILMDHRMPIKNGLEASKEILQIDKSSKIIFISADQPIKKSALALGELDFIGKPLTMKILIDSIKKAL